jgi:hypothetical protein
LHQPVVKPFPESATSRRRALVDANDDGHNHEGENQGEKRDVQAETQDSEQGLAHGALTEQAVAKPPLGN